MLDETTYANDSAARSLDPATCASLFDFVHQAKMRGWLQADLARFFKTRNVDLAAYKAAISGGAVAEQQYHALAALSVTGLPALPYQPNPADIRKHIDWLVEPARGQYDDALFEIAHDGGERGPSHARLFDLDQIDDAVAWTIARNNEGNNIYIGAALRLPDTDRYRRASAADFYVATAVPIDIDRDYDATRARMALACDDGLVVTTGLTPQRRSQHWARLVEPCEDEGDFGHAFAGLVLHSGADLKVKDSARVMRMGGTVSFPKDAKKQAAGYCTELTTVSVNASARSSDIDVLKALAPAEGTYGTAARFDASSRPQGEGIERDWTGRVKDGREAYWRDLVAATIANYQRDNGADPVEDDIWAEAFPVFSDPQKVDNKDGRWTSVEGQKALRARVQNTIRRLRAGRLARFGLASIETGEGAEEARAVAERTPARQPVAPEPISTAADAVFAFDPWERFVVPSFPVDALPPVLRRYTEHQSLVLGADRNGVAMAALVACSAAVSHDFRMKMMRTGDWHVRPRLWGVLVGDPSDKKTPIINSAASALHERDHRAAVLYAKQHAAWQDAVEEKAASRRDEPAKPPRHVVQDVTVEKLSEILSRTDRGALVQRDELGGWVGSMEQYKGKGGAGSADRAHWIKAYDGGRYTVDRVKGETVLTNFSVSFLAGIQPDRLAELGNLTSDGLLQRFLPVMLGKPALPTEVEDDTPGQDYERLINFLADTQPVRLTCESGAYEVVREFQATIHEMEQSGAFSKSFTGFLGKLPGVMGSLALVLHLVEDPEHAREKPVERRTLLTARRLMLEFFIPHALEFYRGADDKTSGDVLRSVASYLLTSPLTRFRPKELTSGVDALRGLSLWDLQQKLSPLIAGGWLRPENDTPTCRAWILEEGVREAFARRAEAEKIRRSNVSSYLAQFRKGADQ